MTGGRSYKVAQLLGRGAFGAVYLADTVGAGLPRKVAVKVLRPGLLSPESIRRFMRETALLGSLRHPWICQVHAAGTFAIADAELPYFVMELVDDDVVEMFCRKTL